MNFKLPKSVHLLVGYCALYTGGWGLVMLLNPAAYFEASGLGGEHFPPGTEFWGWFGVSGGIFYAAWLGWYRRLPYLGLVNGIISLGGVTITLVMLIAGPLHWEMALIHLSGDVAGTVGFGVGAMREMRFRQGRG